MTPSAASDAAAPDIAAGCGVFEILEISDEVRHLVAAGADSNAIDRAAIRAGMTTMVDDGVAKCRAGMTSAAELLRVTTIR